MDSNLSTASANELYGSPYSRSPSGGSLSNGSGSEGGGNRLTSIRKHIDLMEKVRGREGGRKGGGGREGGRRRREGGRETETERGW